MSSDDVQTNLRLPADLKERLVAAATKNSRSLSAEVSYRLEESFLSTGRMQQAADLQDKMNELLHARDSLMARLASTQAQLAALDYEMRSVMADGHTMNEMQRLRDERDELARLSSKVREELDRVVGGLEALRHQAKLLGPRG